ncbi:MAG: hypothetical protein HRT63_12485, partial [Erythrobacter sp.]|nr:hypothetical protein [Erythrobacter sp.]
HDALLGQLADLDVPVLIGPRSGSKTQSFSIPDGLAPGDGVRGLIPLRIVRVESLRDGEVEHGGAPAGAEKDPALAGDGWTISRWREDVETQLTPEFALKDGRGVVYHHKHIRYCAAWPDRTLLDQLVERIAHDAQITLTDLPEGVRMRTTASHQFIFNYSSRPVRLGPDSEVIDPAGVSITALKP